MNDSAAQSIAVLIPCYNEEAAIARVVEDFRSELPEARIWVYDNNSTDDTARIAREAPCSLLVIPPLIALESEGRLPAEALTTP